MIAVKERFEVPSAPQVVWEVVSDPRAVVSCVPGASLGARSEDGTFDASLMVKFGPMRITFDARAALELDAAAMEGRLTANGKDTQGGARMKATIRFGVAPNGTGSVVSVDGEVEVGGRLAPLIEGGAAMVVQRMSTEFAEALAARCAVPSSP